MWRRSVSSLFGGLSFTRIHTHTHTHTHTYIHKRHWPPYPRGDYVVQQAWVIKNSPKPQEYRLTRPYPTKYAYNVGKLQTCACSARTATVPAGCTVCCYTRFNNSRLCESIQAHVQHDRVSYRLTGAADGRWVNAARLQSLTRSKMTRTRWTVWSSDHTHARTHTSGKHS